MDTGQTSLVSHQWGRGMDQDKMCDKGGGGSWPGTNTAEGGDKLWRPATGGFSKSSLWSTKYEG